MTHDPPDSWYGATPFTKSGARYLWWGLAPKIRDAYDTAKNSYIKYCTDMGYQLMFPASLPAIVSWIGSLGDRRLKPKTIKAYLTGLRSFYVDIGYRDDVFDNPVIKRVINGIRRLRGEGDTMERRPITRDVLIHILSTLSQNTLAGATLHAAYCLAFAGFLRIGEFTWDQGDRGPDFDTFFATRRSVRLYDDYLEFTLPSSKTDPFRKGITLTIAATGDEACAVASLRHLTFSLLPRYPSPCSTQEASFPGVSLQPHSKQRSQRSVVLAIILVTHSAAAPQPPQNLLASVNTRS